MTTSLHFTRKKKQKKKMQLRHRSAADDPRGHQMASKGSRRPKNRSNLSVAADSSNPDARSSSRPVPSYVQYEKTALNVTYIATGVTTSPRNLRSGVNHQTVELVSKSRSCRKHLPKKDVQQQPQKAKRKAAFNPKSLPSTSRRDHNRALGK